MSKYLLILFLFFMPFFFLGVELCYFFFSFLYTPFFSFFLLPLFSELDISPFFFLIGVAFVLLIFGLFFFFLVVELCCFFFSFLFTLSFFFFLFLGLRCYSSFFGAGHFPFSFWGVPNLFFWFLVSFPCFLFSGGLVFSLFLSLLRSPEQAAPKQMSSCS